MLNFRKTMSKHLGGLLVQVKNGYLSMVNAWMQDKKINLQLTHIKDESQRTSRYTLPEYLFYCRHDLNSQGGDFLITGLDRHKAASGRPLAVRVQAEV